MFELVQAIEGSKLIKTLHVHTDNFYGQHIFQCIVRILFDKYWYCGHFEIIRTTSCITEVTYLLLALHEIQFIVIYITAKKKLKM